MRCFCPVSLVIHHQSAQNPDSGREIPRDSAGSVSGRSWRGKFLRRVLDRFHEVLHSKPGFRTVIWAPKPRCSVVRSLLIMSACLQTRFVHLFRPPLPGLLAAVAYLRTRCARAHDRVPCFCALRCSAHLVPAGSARVSSSRSATDIVSTSFTASLEKGALSASTSFCALCVCVWILQGPGGGGCSGRGSWA